jgi:RNA polymerase sigma factor (sigma-70 family)
MRMAPGGLPFSEIDVLFRGCDDGKQVISMESDSELLQRYATSGDESAFRTLVERHAAMVNGVALRRTEDRALAEEITQTVFAILARKASALGRESLSGWLHHTAVLEARNVRRKAARYRNALQQFTHHMKTFQSSDNSEWKGIRPHLDEAISRLSRESRDLVVMRFYERKSIREIAGATGKSEEASRKNVERSLHKLNGYLKRRGVLTTEGALAAVLAGQALCVPPASAAAIATGALQLAPGLKTATLLTHTIHAMNIASTVKTSAVVIAICAIPITLLWRQNSELQEELRLARAVPHIAKAPDASGSANPLSEAKKPPVASATATPPATEAGPPGGMAGFAALFSGDGMKKRMKDEVQKRVALEFKRICLNIPDLTDDQKAKIKETLEKKGSDASDQMAKIFQSGVMTRAMQNPESLTKEEKSALAKMDPRKNGVMSDDTALKSLLTEDQLGQYTKAKEARRVSDAENAASDSLRSVSKNIDLSPEQKDKIFQALAQEKLAPAETGEEVSSSFPGMGGRDESSDRIIRENLTPEQAEIFDQSRAQEKESRQQMMQLFGKPPGAAQAPK